MLYLSEYVFFPLIRHLENGDCCEVMHEIDHSV